MGVVVMTGWGAVAWGGAVVSEDEWGQAAAFPLQQQSR